MKLNIDFGEKLRPIGKLNGTNNGPLHCFTDRTAEYKDMGIDFVRFHETHSYNTKCVEIPFIFRDFDADENDPANYYFAETDAVIKSAVDAGIEICYRLGMGTEGEPHLFIAVPKDYEKWARIAIHIMMHYNEGWANGFHYGIRYWEIWNEPDLPNYWPGKRAEYTNFYCTVAPILKAHDKKNKIGGPSSANPLVAVPAPDAPKEVWDNYYDRLPMIPEFLKRCARENIPLDFFAFHGYAAGGETVRAKMRYAMQILRDAGLEGKCEAINTEWAGMHLRRDRKNVWDYTQLYTQKGAMQYLAYMTFMQRMGISKAAYYDSDERSKFCGLYDFDGSHKIHYNVLKMWKLLREYEWEVESEETPLPVTAVAAVGKKGKAVLVVNEGDATRLTLNMKNAPKGSFTVTLLSATKQLEVVRRADFENGTITLALPAESAALIEF